MTDPADPFSDPELDAALGAQGPLSDQVARRLIERGRARLDAGEHALAAADFQRVVGHSDANLTGAAVLGTGDVLYRVDAEDQAKNAWESVTSLPENDSTYQAWRNLAGMRVRAGELREAIDAYRQADRRAPAADKAEIAARLGWLAKETGDTGTANRYFARSRGTAGFGIALIVLVVTAAVSFVAFNVPSVLDALLLDPFWVQHGQLYRLVSVTLVHGGFLHLFLNLYALWIVGPVVEIDLGEAPLRPLLPAHGHRRLDRSFLFSNAASVGASGAIFGLVGVILAGTMAHLRRSSRAGAGDRSQLGCS